jgi:CheY-like chemotaxis protein
MTNKTILLVDDDPDDQLIFTDALNEVNNQFNCFVASNGQEALARLQNMPEPMLIFLDLNMPVMNGFEFLMQIKESRHKQIPVVIYTTSDHPRDKKESLENGAYMFFTKTADFKMLKIKLQEILSELAFD